MPSSSRSDTSQSSDHTMNLIRGSFALVFGGKQRGRMHGGDANPLNDVCILDLHGNPLVECGELLLSVEK